MENKANAILRRAHPSLTEKKCLGFLGRPIGILLLIYAGITIELLSLDHVLYCSPDFF